MRRVLLLSSSRMHGFGYMEFAADTIKDFLNKSDVRTVLFVPYAVAKHDSYTQQVRQCFESFGFELKSIHESEDVKAAANNAQAFFIGGGNTFRLLKTLYDLDLISIIRQRVLHDSIPYIGSSAGSNVAMATICNTNDMPIMYPPSFDALQLLPFNLNPHYMDPDPNSTHMGETREKRIEEYLEVEGALPVLGLREGGMLRVEDKTATVVGRKGGRLFLPSDAPREVEVGADLSHLLAVK